MGKFQQKFVQFMYGRYGMDEYGKHLSTLVFIILIVSLVLSLLSRFVGNWLGYLAQAASWAGWIVLIYFFIRFFSKNITKRREQNMRYLQRKNKKAARQKKAENKKEYKYLTCPQCKQEMRVPRGKGKISVSCPKCGQKTLTHT